MLAKSLIKRMSVEEKTLLRDGAIYTGIFTGGLAYLQYREYIKKEFFRSECHYKFQQTVTNCTPWKQLYFTWWRMPEEEWTIYHRLKKLAYTKEQNTCSYQSRSVTTSGARRHSLYLREGPKPLALFWFLSFLNVVTAFFIVCFLLDDFLVVLLVAILGVISFVSNTVHY